MGGVGGDSRQCFGKYPPLQTGGLHKQRRLWVVAAERTGMDGASGGGCQCGWRQQTVHRHGATSRWRLVESTAATATQPTPAMPAAHSQPASQPSRWAAPQAVGGVPFPPSSLPISFFRLSLFPPCLRSFWPPPPCCLPSFPPCHFLSPWPCLPSFPRFPPLPSPPHFTSLPPPLPSLTPSLIGKAALLVEVLEVPLVGLAPEEGQPPNLKAAGVAGGVGWALGRWVG